MELSARDEAIDDLLGPVAPPDPAPEAPPDPRGINYTASKTVARFFNSRAFVRLIMGPFGSGKSSGCIMEILRRAMAQAKAPDGTRYTRWVVIRNSYRELEDTTIRTTKEWIPEEIREWRASEKTMVIKFNDVNCELLFRALDDPDDVRKLLSLDLTGGWINEAREIPKQVFEMIQARLDRFPAIRNGGCTWAGLIMDTNPPDQDNWIYKVFEEQKPEGHEIFKQPSGLSPEAENLANLAPGYYPRMAIGKTKEWINVNVHGEYGFLVEGKPVYPEFVDSMHVSQEPILVPAGIPILLGMDFGLTPAIVAAYRGPGGQMRVFDEFVSENSGAMQFSKQVARELRTRFPRNSFRGHGDPAGAQRSQVDLVTPFEVVQAAGLPIDPVNTNDFIRRREAVAGMLTRLTTGAQPAMVIDAKCRVLRKGMNGAYCFKRVHTSGERYRDVPDKNSYSHICEALQYLAVGEGEDDRALEASGPADYDTEIRNRIEVQRAFKRR